MDKEKLFELITKAIDRGNNVEIRKKPDGTWQVLEVKKNIVTYRNYIYYFHNLGKKIPHQSRCGINTLCT